MKVILKKSLEQAIPILISALLAAAIAFLQALMAQTMTPGMPAPTVTETGFLGAVIKTAHSAMRSVRVII